MKSFQLNLFGTGMLICGYAAGMKNADGDLTQFPWPVDLAVGGVMVIVAFALHWRRPR